MLTTEPLRERSVSPPEKRWQKYAREAQELRDAIDEHAGVTITDVAGKITFANDLFCQFSGYSREELVGQDHRMMNSGHHDNAFMTDLWSTIQSGAAWHGELKNAAKDGTYYWVETTIVPFLDEFGAPRQYMAIRKLITKRKAAELALLVERDRAQSYLDKEIKSAEAVRIAEERMRFALEAANVGIWDMDYTTGKLEWSVISESHYGLAPGEFDGKFETFLALTHPDDRAGFLEIAARAMATGDDFVTENRTLWRDGTVRFLTGYGRFFHDEHGKLVRGIGISVDDTDRRLLENQFQQSQKMEAIGRLAGGVAHDFNNLLTVITGFAELLQVDCDPADPKQHDIAEIHKAATSAAALTRQLLEFSRKQIIQPTMLDLNEVISHLREMLGRVIGEDVTILLGLRNDVGVIKADRAQIEQVIMNLSVNARDAMPDGGTLTIETSDVVIDEQYARTHPDTVPGHYVRLTVKDTGMGMTPTVQAQLFEPFFTTKEVGKGTGLGLATVHGVVARNGGSITVHSEVGKGTEFRICFPRAADVVTPDELPKVVHEISAVHHRILLVEDASSLREVAIRMLTRLGYDVIAAGNAQEAFELFREDDSIDVLLTDVIMPGGSGPDLARKLVQIRPDLTVIFMSGYTDEAIAQHGVLDPDVALLNKPFNATALDRKIREELKKRKLR